MQNPPDNNAAEERISEPKSTAEKLLQQKAERDKMGGIEEENFEEYKKALNGMAATPFGEHVLKTWVKAFGIFTVKPNRDGVALVGDKALRDFYLTYVRPHLDTELRQNIER